MCGGEGGKGRGGGGRGKGGEGEGMYMNTDICIYYTDYSNVYIVTIICSSLNTQLLLQRVCVGGWVGGRGARVKACT